MTQLTKTKRRWSLKKAEEVAEYLRMLLTSCCKNIVVAGSIRRRKSTVGDIELLCIPLVLVMSDMFGGPADRVDMLDRSLQELVREGILDYRRNSKGKHLGYGLKNKFMVHVASGSGIPVDVFSTTKENWAMSLVVRTGPAAFNKRLMAAAQALGMRGHAYGSGFSTPDGSTLVCHTEEEVLAAVGWPYTPPEERM